MKRSLDQKIISEIAGFASAHVSSRPDLQTGQDFPADIWRKMGETGFFKIGVSEMYGGVGGGYLALSQAGEVFVKSGYNLGLAVSWLYQQILAHYLVSVFGTPNQRRQYLRALAEGKITLSFAVSEPGRGAHPKMIITSAEKRDKCYVLSGEKTYLTNGPIAGIFIVVAVTDPNPAQKRFTAFIVPRNHEGLKVTPPMPMNFLKPSPHSGIVLTDCLVPKRAILGEEGGAWRDMVVPIGDMEDVVMMGPAVGAMAAQMAMMVATVRRHAGEPDNALLAELGTMSASLQALRAMAYEAATRLDSGKTSSIPLLITFVRLAADYLASVSHFFEDHDLEPPAEYADLQRDAVALVSLKKRLMQIRQEKLGAHLMRVG
ncbi:MAG: acyl-CoA dehydrogenase family protein [Smithellaceae bacterium]